MKILYISHANNWGGATVALFNEIIGMKNKGHDVVVITPSTKGPFIDKLDSLNVKYYACKNLTLTIYPKIRNPLRWLKRTVFLVYNIIRTKSFIREVIIHENPDIVHTNVGPLSQAADVCFELDVPHVWHHREYQDKDFGMYFFPSKSSLKNKIYRKRNYNIAITQGVFDYRLLRNGQDIVIYDGVFSSEITESKRNHDVADKQYILFAGRVQESKGTIELIKVYRRFHTIYPEVKLCIAGDYSEESRYFQKCKSFISKYNLQNDILFLGQRMDVYDLMSQALMLVVPSRFEGFGFITAEAMLNHCIVVGKNTAGTKEQFDNGLSYTGREIGYRFNDSEGMYQCMLLAMRTDNRMMKDDAYNTVVHYYTIEHNSDKLENFYSMILDDNDK